MTEEKFLKTVLKEKIVAIVRGASPETIINVAQSLVKGNICLMEITCDTSEAPEMIKVVNKKMKKEILLGAGTVTSPQLAEASIKAGAEYIIAPNLDLEVVNYCQKRGVPIIPGVATPTEILQATKYGVRMVKLFPAAALGPDYIKQIRSPIKKVKILAVGGINFNNASEMLQAGADALGIGGSLVNSKMVKEKNWREIEHRAKELVKIVNRD